MLIIPVTDAPNQTLGVTLANQVCNINLVQNQTGLYCDLLVANSPIIQGVICENLNRIVRDTYLGFDGDLIWQDTQGTSDPTFPGLGTRYLLAYLTAAEAIPPPVPPPPYTPPPGPSGWYDNGGWLTLDAPGSYPTSSANLPAGALWSNGLIVTVVPGATPDPSAPAVYFPAMQPATLLALGGANLPTSAPAAGTGQLWNQGGIVSIA